MGSPILRLRISSLAAHRLGSQERARGPHLWQSSEREGYDGVVEDEERRELGRAACARPGSKIVSSAQGSPAESDADADRPVVRIRFGFHAWCSGG
jgi:hypothetical protein